MKVLLFTPPLTQLNTPYPASAYLTGFLRERGFDVVQDDPSIKLILKILSRNGLQRIREVLLQSDNSHSFGCEVFLAQFERYCNVVEPVVRFLQGKDVSLAYRIASRNFLPEGPAFEALLQWEEMDDPNLDWAFGQLGVLDRGKYFATLFLNDIASVIREGIDPKFELSRYAERIATHIHNFGDIERLIESYNTLIDEMLDEIANELIDQHQPDVVGMSVPFPGNLVGGLRIAKTIKTISPDTTVLFGGGYVNTELRELKEPKLFKYVDYVTLDDGELPILRILESIQGKDVKLHRTFALKEGSVVYHKDTLAQDIHHNEIGCPTYDGLPLGDYLSIMEMLNPMHRIWSDTRWNKLTLAHGCYWSKCSFCDVSLDYISRYQEADVETIVGRIERIVEEIGHTGFHFVDEAAPPKVMFALARRIIEKGLNISWWGNIRFEKSFNEKTCKLLAESGCIAVTGGLEVASNDLLEKMNKGVTVEQVARVTRAFADAGVLVHAYLMYGFPGQTEQDTVDALERVRQLFAAGCIQSGFWHRFAATIHSPVGMDPEKFGIRLIEEEDGFSQNDVEYVDSVRCNHEMLGRGLKKALYNFMLGIGLDEEVSFWFEENVPETQVPVELIEQALG